MKGHRYIYEYKCLTTNLLFFVPNDVDGSGQFYGQLQKFDWYYMAEKWEYKKAIQRLKPISNVLEVGCGEGDFVALCMRHGHTVTGIELNPKAVEIARKKGLDVYEKNLYELSKEKLNHYDYICAFQVLEHISKPKEFINSCIKILKPGGRLIFCVPNSAGLLAQDFSLLDMPPHHMTRWNKAAFKSLEHIFEVDLKNVYFEPLARYHWDWYISSVRKKIKLGDKYLSNRLHILFHKILSLGFNTFVKGHTIFVEFRKI